MNPTVRLRAFALLLALFCIAVVGLRWWQLSASHEALRADTLAAMGQRAGQLASAVAREVDAELKAADLALLQLRHDYLTEAGGEFFNSIAVARTALGAHTFTGFLATDRSGQVRYSTLSRSTADVSLADRDYFRDLSAGGGDRLLVGHPVEGRFTEGWIIPVVRPILVDGRFAGVGAIGMRPEFFAMHLADLGLASDDVVAVVLADGAYLARSSGMEQALGRSLPPDRPFLVADAPARGVARLDANFDGRRRTFGWRRLDDLPVVVVVGLDEQNTLMPVEEEIGRARRHTIIGNAIVLILGLTGVMLLRRFANQQQALEGSEKRLRAVLNTVGEGIVVSDADARIMLANPAAERILGLAHEEIGGTVLHSEAWEPLRADGSPCPPEGHPQAITLATGQAQHEVILGLRRPDGQRIWIEIDTEPLVTPGEAKPHAVVGSFTEVTDRLESQRRVGLMASVFANTTEGVFIAAPDGRILEVNHAFTTLTGLRSDEAVGAAWTVLDDGLATEARFVTRMADELRIAGVWREEVPLQGSTLLLTASAVRDDKGRPTAFVGLLADVSKLKENEQRLHRMAHFDALTGLPNRLLLQDRLDQALARASRAGEVFAICFLDLDGFKDVNDSLGHEAGDLLLKEVARRLHAAVRAADSVARLGGDEFVILLLGLEWPGDADSILDRVMRAIAAPYEIQGAYVTHISASIGVVCYPEDGTTVAELMQRADMSMYAAKRAGRHCIRRYEPEA